jgi:hypothetical protein
VKRNFAIRRLLAILVIAGLALAPLSRPVMAVTSSDASMQAMADEQMVADDMSSSATTDEMANDMPCCPPKAPAPVGCDKCLFMTACASTCFTGILAAVFHPLLTASDDIASPKNDSGPDGLGDPPPEHPPRTQV